METSFTFLNKIIHDDQKLMQKLALWHFQNKKVVFTNGCFDIIHRGHVEYLYKAANLGDILILGLNTDSSVKRLKGPERPVVDLESRAIVLAALYFIDYIIFFDEDTPYELIKKIQPDILVKGGDYKPENIVGYDIVKSKKGEVVTIPLVQGFSTSRLIHKLNQD